MDGNRFDTLARRVGTPTSRRAALGAAVAGGVLGALGLGRAVPEARAAQDGACVMTFAAQLQQGPSSQQPLIPGGRAGEVRGDLSFSLSDRGALDNATLTLADGTSLSVVGDATGHGLQLRIALGSRQALVVIGVGEQAIAQCQGAIDGVATGPQSGDLGDWHASAAGQQAGGGSEQRSGKKDRANTAPGGAAAATGGKTRAPRDGNQGSGSSGGGANPASSSQPAANPNAQPCPQGQTFCSGEGDYCADLQTDPRNCGACGEPCAVNNCTAGVCGEASASLQNCAPPFAVCGDACVNLQTDALHCGACGNMCPVNNCAGGVCGGGGIQNCAPPFAVCGDACVDTTTDPTNCGGCGITCAAGETCQGGVCVPPAPVCAEGQADCGGGCIDITSDLNNCGGCGLSCGAQCVDGQCTGVGAAPTVLCPAGLTLCGDACRDLQTSAFSCGSCDITCPTGVCQEGVCGT